MILNTRGVNREQIPKPLSDLLDYIAHPENENDFTDDPLITAIKTRVKTIKRDRTREVQYMLFEEMMDDARAEGFAEGKATGTATGLLRGKTEERKRFQMLIERLSEDDRMEDIMKVADDSDYLEQLFHEYEL